MFAFIRQIHPRIRLWLLAAAAVLLLTSVIEAGHAHGLVTEANDHCVLCQHSDILAQLPLTANDLPLPSLLEVALVSLIVCLTLPAVRSNTPIRAPPV